MCFHVLSYALPNQLARAMLECVRTHKTLRPTQTTQSIHVQARGSQARGSSLLRS